MNRIFFNGVIITFQWIIFSLPRGNKKVNISDSFADEKVRRYFCAKVIEINIIVNKVFDLIRYYEAID